MVDEDVKTKRPKLLKMSIRLPFRRQKRRSFFTFVRPFFVRKKTFLKRFFFLLGCALFTMVHKGNFMSRLLFVCVHACRGTLVHHFYTPFNTV